MRWLTRYLAESSSSLQHFAEITASLGRAGVVRQAGGTSDASSRPTPPRHSAPVHWEKAHRVWLNTFPFPNPQAVDGATL